MIFSSHRAVPEIKGGHSEGVLSQCRSPRIVKGLLLCKHEFVTSAPCDGLPANDAAHL